MQEVQVCCLIDTKKCRQSHFPDLFAQNGRPQEKMSLIYKKQQQYNKQLCTGWIKKVSPWCGCAGHFPDWFAQIAGPRAKMKLR